MRNNTNHGSQNEEVSAHLSLVVRDANAKVSDGSQLPGASASPLGVPAGARSQDRLFESPQLYPKRLPMFKIPNENCHKSVFARVAGWTGHF